MGIWGFGLYQNDLTLDVKDRFDELLKEGRTVQEVTDQLAKEYKSMIGHPDEEPLFWMALADVQWNCGQLLPAVKEKALDWICKGIGTFPRQTGTTQERAQWEKTLTDLREKLLSPQPSIKVSSKKRIYKCKWKLGDVFAYQLESDLARERGFWGRYFLIQKIDEAAWSPGHIVPIVYVKITKDARLPLNIEEYNQLEYVQTWFTRYEDRFLPIDMGRPQEDIAEKSRKNYQTDTYGFLPQYRVKLLNTSSRVIPDKLIYVGNFVKADPPEKEFIPHTKDNIVTVAWKQFDETFETKMIKRYCGHNLRELSIYNNGT